MRSGKLKSKRGETLIETLTALLVATLVLLFLATSIAVASRINKRLRQTDTSFRYPAETPSQAAKQDVTIYDGTSKLGSVSVSSYTDETGYYRYYKGEDTDD